MIISVVREFHWTPEYIDGLHHGDEDRFCLGYWYNDIVKAHKELSTNKT
jgi:hypothetical protein